MRRYKVGILGSGVISRTYLADIQAFYHALDVTACADLYVQRASALAQEFGVPHAYTVEQLLALNPSIKNPNLIYAGQKVRVA